MIVDDNVIASLKIVYRDDGTMADERIVAYDDPSGSWRGLAADPNTIFNDHPPA